MGKYAAIGKKDYKLSGLIAQACDEVGVKVDEHTHALTLTKSLATDVLTQMAISFEEGRTVVRDGSINGQDVYRLAMDAAALSALFDWVVTSKDDATIVFG